VAYSGATVMTEEEYWDLRNRGLKVGMREKGIESCEDGYSCAPFIMACG
jgi:hypothetical protein